MVWWWQGQIVWTITCAALSLRNVYFIVVSKLHFGQYTMYCTHNNCIIVDGIAAAILEVFMYQTLARVFDHVSKVEKRGAAEFYNKSSRCLETWSNTRWVFDTTSQTNTYFRRKRRRKFGLFMQVFDHISKPVMLVIFLCLSSELLMAWEMSVVVISQFSTK